MQAVILAAGRGTRLGELTASRPKPLIEIHGRPILDYTFASLPDTITEIIMVVGYCADQIISHCGSQQDGRPIRYVEQTKLGGTFHALMTTEPLLKSPFLVLQGDDIHTQAALATCISHPLAYGVSHRAPAAVGALAIEMTNDGHLAGAHMASDQERQKGILITTGVYVLNHDFFKQPPVHLANGELALPHTILEFAKHTPVRAVPMPDWVSINTPADIAGAERNLTSFTRS